MTDIPKRSLDDTTMLLTPTFLTTETLRLGATTKWLFTLIALAFYPTDLKTYLTVEDTRRASILIDNMGKTDTPVTTQY